MTEDKNRSRLFNILLYPDNPKHNLAIIELQTVNYLACGCCHNMDVYEDGEKAGEIKKAHYHFVVKFSNPRYKSGVAKALDIEERFIDITNSFKGSAKYLLHYGDDTKYQYSPDDLVGRLKPDVLKLLEDKPSEAMQARYIADYIMSVNRYLTRTELFNWCLDNGYYSCYRRGLSVFDGLIYEHNEKYVNVNGVKK